MPIGDGRDLWVVTKREGVWIVSTSGEILRTINADQGLPPYDQAEVLHPAAEGKALMAGSFGENRRGWCAMINTAKERPVEVLHEATTVYSATSTPDDDSFSQAFRPTFIHEYRSADEGLDYYIVGRDISHGPLLVDCETLEVSEMPKCVESKLPNYIYNRKRGFFNPLLRCSRHSRDLLFFRGGRTMVIPSSSEPLAGSPFKLGGNRSNAWRLGVTVWPSPLDPGGTGERLTRRWNARNQHSYHLILPVGRWLYVPGRNTWYRLDRETFREGRVYPMHPSRRSRARPTPRPSSHYGIVFTGAMLDYPYRPFGQIKIHEGP
jgi:hypothetical protein